MTEQELKRLLAEDPVILFMWKYHLNQGGDISFYDRLNSVTLSEIQTMYCLDQIYPIPNHWLIGAVNTVVTANSAGDNKKSIDDYYPTDTTLFEPDEDEKEQILKKLRAKKEKNKNGG